MYPKVAKSAHIGPQKYPHCSIHSSFGYSLLVAVYKELDEVASERVLAYGSYLLTAYFVLRFGYSILEQGEHPHLCVLQGHSKWCNPTSNFSHVNDRRECRQTN